MKLLRLSCQVALVATTLFATSAFGQTVVETTEELEVPQAPSAERNQTPIIYWMLIDTSGSMTEERVARARQTYYEVDRSLRSGVDEARVFGFPETGFARCGPNPPVSEFTGLPRPDRGGSRPIQPIGRQEVDAMRHGRGQSRTTPLWPALAELLHDIRQVIASDPRFRHRLLVVTDRGCDTRHCTRERPAADIDDLGCPALNEDALRDLLPGMAEEQLLGSGVNQIAWTLVDQAAQDAPSSSLCGRGVDCSDDSVGSDTLIPEWRFGQVEISLPEGAVLGLASRRIDVRAVWPIVQVGLDEIRASLRVAESDAGPGPLLAQEATRYVAVDASSPLELAVPVAMNPRLSDRPRPNEAKARLSLQFGTADGGANRAATPVRTFELTLPTEYVIVPLSASAGELVPVPVGSTLRFDISADVAPLVDLLSLEGLEQVGNRLEVGAISYGALTQGVGLSATLDPSGLASGRLVLVLEVTRTRDAAASWERESLRAASAFVEATPDAMAVVLRDRNGWFQLSPLAVADFSCAAPCDQDSTCTDSCDARCCTVVSSARQGHGWWKWLLCALLIALAVAAWLLWRRRYPDPRGLVLEFESPNGPRQVRLFREYSPWHQPLSVVSAEELQSALQLKARCSRDGTVEVKTDPPTRLRAGSRPPDLAPVLARLGKEVAHASDLEFLEEKRTYKVAYRPGAPAAPTKSGPALPRPHERSRSGD